MLAIHEISSDSVSVLRIEGSLRTPLSGELRRRVQALLTRGERRIVLDLGRVPDLDAGGIGELVRVYNLTIERDGALWIANASETVQRILERVGLFHLLNGAVGRRAK